MGDRERGEDMQQTTAGWNKTWPLYGPTADLFLLKN